MMIIDVSGIKKHDKNIILKATEFYAGQLMTPRMCKNISLELVHDNSIVADGYDGFCEWVEENINPREFILTINCHRPIDQVLTSIAHEMVHVSQFTSNKLKHRIRPSYRFIWEDEDIIVENYHYVDLPWEREAYMLESVLYNRFIESETL